MKGPDDLGCCHPEHTADQSCKHKDKSCLHFVLWEVTRVQAEVSIAIHVVDVSPHDFQGDVCCLVLGHHLSQLLNILIAPPATPLALLYHPGLKAC